MPQVIPPLHWPDAFHEPSKRTWKIWLISPWSNFADVERGIKEQLLTRQRPDSVLWGSDPLRFRVGQTVCRVIKEQYDWPNDYFIPQDLIDIVCLVPYDDLDLVEVALRLEELLGVVMSDTEIYGFSTRTLGDFVDWIVNKLRSPQ